HRPLLFRRARCPDRLPHLLRTTQRSLIQRGFQYRKPDLLLGVAVEAILTPQRLAGSSPGRFAEIVGNMPASYFGIVLGIAGLANAWRAAVRVWQLPEFIAEWIYIAAGGVWAMLVALYTFKAILTPEKLMEEAAHPVQCCFIGLAGVATMLVA